MAHHHFSNRTRIPILTFALTPDELDKWGALEPIYNSKVIYGSLGIEETVKKGWFFFLLSGMNKVEKSLEKGVTVIAQTAPVLCNRPEYIGNIFSKEV